MTGTTLNIGLSGLLAAQRGLSTTGHNIANVATQGFSRQRVMFETRPPQLAGAGYIGSGVDTLALERVADQFLVDQLRVATANEAGAAKYRDLLDQLDAQLGGSLVGDGVQSFFDALGDASDDPRLTATRQVLLQRARGMVDRLADQEDQLNQIGRQVSDQVTASVNRINALTDAIARVNIDIARSVGRTGDDAAPDLIDRRDQLVVELANHAGVQVQYRGDHMINVLLGSGTLVVAGGTANALATRSDALDVSRTEVVLDVNGSQSDVTNTLSGGELGALLEFRDEILEPGRNAIGRLGATLAMTLNEQHRAGMDLNGNLGGDLFSIPAPTVRSAATNSGSIAVAFDPANVDQLGTSDYALRHDGTDFVLTRLPQNTTQVLSGGGPFSVDGLTITVTSPPAAGDEYLLQPTKFIPRTMALAVSDTSSLALASPVRTGATIGNIGDATISRPQILDPADAGLLATVSLVFNDPPTTYQVNGAGPLLPYTSGSDIDVNGWRIQIDGVPGAGDSFVVESNAGGVGDNGNALALGAKQFEQLMVNGTTTYQGAFGLLIGDVGSSASQARTSLEALSSLHDGAVAARESFSGVNLEEEAANLLRFQQLFQAAAQVISTADATFQALLDATR